MTLSRSVLIALVVVWPTLPAWALTPKEVFLVSNKKVKESGELARFYCQKRGVPTENVLSLELPTGEDISRADYDKLLAEPLRQALKERRDQVRVLLTLHGVPLRVGARQLDGEEQKKLATLRKDLNEARNRLKDLEKAIDEARKAAKEAPLDRPAFDRLKMMEEERDKEAKRTRELEPQVQRLSGSESVAAVDSELSLLWFPAYDLNRWQLNLLYWQVPESLRKDKPRSLMVARLDGPTLALCKRLVEDAIAVEVKGLEGKVYVDARGIKRNPMKDDGFGYSAYDESLREMAGLLKNQAKLSVILDDKGELFAPQSCPDCALYCGWYSHAKYVPCCKFVQGAVAYHIASSEAVSLRRADVKYWCKNLLEDGAAATLGPVAEPYTIAFPKPEEFYGFLVTGEYTLVESYWRSVLLSSWMMTLVGDPLYNPYVKSPKLKSSAVQPSPKGFRLGFRPR